MQAAILRIIFYRCHMQTQKSGLITKPHTGSCIDWQPMFYIRINFSQYPPGLVWNPAGRGKGGWRGSSASPGFNNQATIPNT